MHKRLTSKIKNMEKQYTTIERKEMIREFVKFLKENNAMAKFMMDFNQSTRTEKYYYFERPYFEEYEMKDIIDSTLWWLDTIAGYNFYDNLHNLWKIRTEKIFKKLRETKFTNTTNDRIKYSRWSLTFDWGTTPASMNNIYERTIPTLMDELAIH